MTKTTDVELAGRPFTLLADCGIFCQASSMLFVADTHFGKEATFRRHGIPVPTGTTDVTLEKISSMLAHTRSQRLCILGDMFHARSSLSKDVCQSLERFFVAHPNVSILLVRGNHDKHVGRFPVDWPVDIIEPGTNVAEIVLNHHPIESPDDDVLRLCGHLHPAIRMASKSEHVGKLPCFWYSRGQLVLPAIGEFTGTHAIRLSRGDRAWITTQQEIFSVC